jgi:hypothetical protein
MTTKFIENKIVSMRANKIKSDATVDEIRKVADFYEKLLKDK